MLSFKFLQIAPLLFLTIPDRTDDLKDVNSNKIMASSKAYLEFILEQLSELKEITYRAMMGEFIIYYRRKILTNLFDSMYEELPEIKKRK